MKKCFERLINVTESDILSYLKYALLPFILAIVVRYILIKYTIQPESPNGVKPA